MRAFPAILTALGVFVLSACAGGGGGGAVGSPDSVLPSGSTVAFESGTIWAAYTLGTVRTYPTNANGSVKATQSFGGFDWPPSSGSFAGVADLAVAPDGTIWFLLNRDAVFGGGPWHLEAYPPGSAGPKTENFYDGPGLPVAFGLGGDGVLVESGAGPWVIETYPYGHSGAPPIRTFTVPDAALKFAGFVMGYNSRIYLARPDGFDSYRPESTGCCPVDHVVTTVPPSDSQGSFAVGPDNSIYSIELIGFHKPNPPPGGATMYVDVYPPGSGTPARRIGPLPVDNGGLANAPVINVDAKNRLYVMTMSNIYVFGPRANGSATPLRTISPFEATFGRIKALAIGP